MTRRTPVGIRPDGVRSHAMDVSIRHDPGSHSCVVGIVGDVDIGIVDELREALDSVMEQGCTNVVFDLSAVDYADSSALGLLVWADRRLAPVDGKVVLSGANTDVARILELSGLIGLAPSIMTRESVREALEGLETVELSDAPLWQEQLDCPAAIDELSAIRGRVVELLADVPLSPAAVFDIKVAIGEALANAVRHGSSDDTTDTLTIDVIAYADRVVIRVIDKGCGFDGTAQCGDDVYASSGRGVMFMRALMDEVDFECGINGGTIVTLMKRVHAGVPTPE